MMIANLIAVLCFSFVFLSPVTGFSFRGRSGYVKMNAKLPKGMHEAFASKMNNIDGTTVLRAGSFEDIKEGSSGVVNGGFNKCNSLLEKHPLSTTMMTAGVIPSISLPSRSVFINDPIKDMTMKELLELVPDATGEVEFVEDGKWVVQNLQQKPANVPAGPLVCIVAGAGVNLGPALQMTSSVGLSSSSQLEPTFRGVQLLRSVQDQETPTGHWCEVLVTNVDTGKSGKYIALVDTGATFSALPAVGERLGVEAGGFTHTLTAMGLKKTVCGAARVKLLRLAFPEGLDPSTGNELHSYQDLPSSLKTAIKNEDAFVVVQMESEVPLIGLNLLGTWGVAVDAHLGLIPSPRNG